MRAVPGYSVLLAASFALIGCQSGASPLFVSRDQVVSVCLSPSGKEIALVTLSKGENVLQIAEAGAPPRVIVRDVLIRNVQFLDENRLVYATRSSIWLYVVRKAQTVTLAAGTRPVCSSGRDRMVYLQDNSTRFRNLADGTDSRVKVGNDVMIPCDWLNDDHFLACKDGSLWKVNLDGGREMLLEGNRFSPWYVDARLSPDRRNVLAFSDDTKANVGAGARSTWVMRLDNGTAEKLTGSSSAQWLDSRRIIALSDGKLVVVDVDTKAQSVLVSGVNNVGSFAVAEGKVVFAVRMTDEDGLYKGSSVYSIPALRRIESHGQND